MNDIEINIRRYTNWKIFIKLNEEVTLCSTEYTQSSTVFSLFSTVQHCDFAVANCETLCNSKERVTLCSKEFTQSPTMFPLFSTLLQCVILKVNSKN